MRKSSPGWLIIVALLGLLSLQVGAQPLPFPPDAARFQKLTVERGLSQSTVMALAQDQQGLIWVGTQNGLNRFDGHEVSQYLPNSDNPRSVSDNFIMALDADPDGSVWVASLDGLSRFRPERGDFDVHRHQRGDAGSLPSNTLMALHRDARGDLWIGSEGGLSRWQPREGNFLNFALPADEASTATARHVTAIASDRHGHLWVGTPQGLLMFDVERREFVRPADFPLPQSVVASVQVDAEDRVWVGTDRSGIVLGLGDRQQWLRLGQAERPGRQLSSDAIRTVLIDQGRVWVGSDLGLDLIDEPAELEFQYTAFRHRRSNPSSIGGGGVAALRYDREGTLWVGTWNGGVAWLNVENNRFVSYTPDVPSTAALSNPASIGLVGEGPRLWVGTGEGLFTFDIESQRLQPLFGGKDSFIYYSGRLKDRQVWYATTRGLSVFDIDQPVFNQQVLPEPLPGARLRRVWVDDDAVWLAVDGQGIARLSPDLKQLLSLQPIGRAVTFIEPLGDSLRLVGSYDGLFWFDARSGRLLHQSTVSEGRSADPHVLPRAPMAFARTADGRRWVASNGMGLLRLDGEVETDPASAQFVPVLESPRLRDASLKSMLVDRQQRLWISSATGITLYEPGSDRVRNFDGQHGTLNRDYINGAAAMLGDGRLAFGAMDGFTVFDPELAGQGEAHPPPAPLVSAMELDVLDSRGALTPQRISVGSAPLRIPAQNARKLTVLFGSLDYIDAESIVYEHRLDGFDSEGWRQAGRGQRSAVYTNLPPGDYQFRVRASHQDSSWSEETRLLWHIEPRWWQTPWAQLLMVALAVLLLLAIHRLRLLGLARQREQLARQVHERTAELEERTRALQESKNHAEQALQRLESTQLELVRSEKMAALGQLVAGVAHEVNTPLGVALTAGSLLRDATRTLQKRLDEGALKRTELTGFLETVNESAWMIERNLDRAAHLISNFKQVSVDRTSDGRRQFELRSYLNEVLESLELMWKRRSIAIDVQVDEGIEMDSFPGALAQVITNFTQNAVRHAFDEGQPGEMSIRAALEAPGRVRLVFGDNGKGVSPENLARIFDPFFTTRRNEGGTGLGLHIVFNLVTQKLGGSIHAESTPGEGTRFVLVLPLRAPD